MLRSISLALSLAVLLLASASQSAPLNLVLEPTPDIVSGTIDIQYTAASDVFSATGFAFDLDGLNLDAPGSFSLSAIIDEFGVLSSGTLSILGTQAPLLNSGTLLTGSLTNFGFAGDATGMLFEFEFDVTGGDLAPAYSGAPGGVIMSSTLNSFSGFGSDFDNLIFDILGTGGGISDTAPIPEPGTALLLGLGLALMGSRQRHV